MRKSFEGLLAESGKAFSMRALIGRFFIFFNNELITSVKAKLLEGRILLTQGQAPI